MKCSMQNLNLSDFEKLFNVPIRIYIGEINNELVTDIIEGKIIDLKLASNSPNLPVSFSFMVKNNSVKSFNVYNIKYFEIL